jgi:hypothetical protein
MACVMNEMKYLVFCLWLLQCILFPSYGYIVDELIPPVKIFFKQLVPLCNIKSPSLRVRFGFGVLGLFFFHQ